MGARGHMAADLGQMHVRGFDVDKGQHDCGADAALRADSAEQVDRGAAVIAHRTRARSLWRPHAGQRALLTDASLVHEPNLDGLALCCRGQGEWCAAKHGQLRRRWLKLHIGVDATTGEVFGSASGVEADADADDATLDAAVAEAQAEAAALASAPPPPEPVLVEADGWTVRALSMGEGDATPVLMIHGFGGVITSPAPERHRVVRPKGGTLWDQRRPACGPD